MSSNPNFRAGGQYSSSSPATPSGARTGYNPAVKTSNYTLTTSDYMVRFDASSGAKMLTLPDAALFYNNGIGQQFAIKKMDMSTNVVMINPTSPQKIDGGSTININNQNSCIIFISNGSGWDITASF